MNWLSARATIGQAFGRYEDLMRAYVAGAQQLPPGGVAGYAPRSSAAIALRMMAYWPMKNLIASHFAKAGDLTLPDYDEPNCPRVA
ncbi:MAG: hypothetical protein JO057_29600 [Chloroflexi bacterium]|nr:hypothetical protein [Chloroflexota bacterium]